MEMEMLSDNPYEQYVERPQFESIYFSMIARAKEIIERQKKQENDDASSTTFDVSNQISFVYLKFLPHFGVSIGIG